MTLTKQSLKMLLHLSKKHVSGSSALKFLYTPGYSHLKARGCQIRSPVGGL